MNINPPIILFNIQPIITVPISILDDDNTNLDREFGLTLTDTALSTAAFNITVPEATIIIIDDDELGKKACYASLPHSCMWFGREASPLCSQSLMTVEWSLNNYNRWSLDAGAHKTGLLFELGINLH